MFKPPINTYALDRVDICVSRPAAVHVSFLLFYLIYLSYLSFINFHAQVCMFLF